jgi:CRP-like cAMP-binding protein
MTVLHLTVNPLAEGASLVYNRPGSQLSNGKGKGSMKQLAFLRQVPLFANLTDRELQALAADFVPLTFRQHFMRTLSTRLRYTTEQAGSLAFLDVYRRVARKLLELAEGHGVAEAEGVRIAVPLTQQELATMVSATRESTNKALAAFRRQGLIRLQRGQIIVVNPQALWEYVT